MKIYVEKVSNLALDPNSVHISKEGKLNLGPMYFGMVNEDEALQLILALLEAFNLSREELAAERLRAAKVVKEKDTKL